jgi:30S ribosomal protein S31
MASLIVAPSSLCCSSSAFFTPVAVRGAGAASTSSSVAVSLPAIVCGRGDRRTAKGKRARGSFGNSRPKDSSKGTGLAVTPLPPRPKKDVEDTEYIHVDIDESLFNN